MSELEKSQEEYKLDNFSKSEIIRYSCLALLIVVTVGFGVFYITPARVVFNRVFHHSIECTVESSKASSSGTRSLATHGYYLDVYTTDCGHLSETRNFSAEDTAQKLNEMKGQKITVNIGYLPWYFEGKEINEISSPEGL